MLEREIKLPFASAAEARAAILAGGALPLRGRRLQEDCLLDTADEQLRRARSVLRVRVESSRSLLTFKGPVQPSAMKVREELETVIGDGEVMVQLLQALGFHIWFRYQKYREEFSREGVVVAIDETPVGVFVEVEGDEAGITAMAAALGRTPADYVVDSYRTLYVRDCHARGVQPADMVFDQA
ncbi:MAG: class IV adenylate cyclase [Acidobacteriota bacterium]|nr:class IV adenylate cyclase [Acidobacteriota bacterium]